MTNNKKKSKNEIIDVQRDVITPFEIGIPNLNKIIEYFLYYVPNIDCVHSKKQIKNNDKVLQKICTIAGFENRYNFFKNVTHKTFLEFDLEKEKIDISVPRMKCNILKNESMLTALLRHIRNAFAHGLVYKVNKKNSKNILLIDKNNNHKCTAKIVIKSDTLKEWKKILEKV